MDKYNLIRSGIFLIAGLACIIFGKQLNTIKNQLFKKLKLKKLVRDERKAYIPLGIVFIIIAIGLLIYAVTH